MSKPRYYRRSDAAKWFAERGLLHVTAGHLADLADQGAGPAYHRLGRYAYYAEADLQAWLDASLKPVERGRTKPRTQAA